MSIYPYITSETRNKKGAIVSVGVGEQYRKKHQGISDLIRKMLLKEGEINTEGEREGLNTTRDIFKKSCHAISYLINKNL